MWSFNILPIKDGLLELNVMRADDIVTKVKVQTGRDIERDLDSRYVFSSAFCSCCGCENGTSPCPANCITCNGHTYSKVQIPIEDVNGFITIENT